MELKLPMFPVFLLALLALASCRGGSWVQKLVESSLKDTVTLKAEDRKGPAAVTIRLAYEESADWPKGSRFPTPEHAAALVFKGSLEDASGGEIIVALYGAGILGDDTVILELLQKGALEMAFTGPATAAVFPPLQLLNLPYVFKGEADMLRFFDESPLWADMAGDFADRTTAAIVAAAARGPTFLSSTHRAVRTPADLAGFLVAVPQVNVYGRTVTALGAIPVGTPESAVEAALAAKTADAALAPLYTNAARRWYLLQGYVTATPLIMEETFLLAAVSFLSSLSDSQRAAFDTASVQAEAALRITSRLLNHTLHYNALTSVSEVYTPKPEETAAFKAAVKDVYGWLGREEVGEALLQQFLEETGHGKSSVFEKGEASDEKDKDL